MLFRSEGKFKSVPFLVKMKQRVAAGKKLKEEVKLEETSSGEYNDPISRMRKKDNEQKRNNVTDKSGAVHTPMSRARHLARMAMQKQMTKPVKESLEESRKAQIVREAMKSAKDKMKKTVADEDKFVANPELNSKVIKTASQM